MKEGIYTMSFKFYKVNSISTEEVKRVMRILIDEIKNNKSNIIQNSMMGIMSSMREITEEKK